MADKTQQLVRRAIEDEGPEGLVALSLLRRRWKGRTADLVVTKADDATSPMSYLLRCKNDEINDLKREIDRLTKPRGCDAKFDDQYRAIMDVIRTTKHVVYRSEIVAQTGLSEATVRRRLTELVRAKRVKEDEFTRWRSYELC